MQFYPSNSSENPISFSSNSFITRDGLIEFGQYFFFKNQAYPHSINYYDSIDINQFYEAAKKHFKVSDNKYWVQESFGTYSTPHRNIMGFLLELQQDLMICYDPIQCQLKIYYGSKVASQTINEIIAFMQKFPADVEVEERIYLLYESYDNLYLQDFHVRSSKIDLKLNYNDDFMPIHKKIISRLNTQNDKGLVLLHGSPGTGKTHYIRYLTSLIKKRMIYIPPDYADKISSPHFLPLMISNPNSVLIIEDAESIVEARDETGRSAAVSGLLNVADGLLSDCLNLQIICTFNTHISNIDKALLRKGRLIANYEFKPLEVEKANKLSKTIGSNQTYTEPIPLTEIYNAEEEG